MGYHIAFCINDEYADYVRVSIKGIIENHKASEDYYKIYILSDFISPKRTKNLLKLNADSNNIKIQIHLIDDSKLKLLKTGSWPIHAWYRILLPELLPQDVNKVLYLDADTLVTSDLNQLFCLDLKEKSIAASMDYQDLFYMRFNVVDTLKNMDIFVQECYY